MGLLSRAGHALLGAAVAAVATPCCYSAGSGSAPPPDTFYFPTGLAVSPNGTVLYAINSDFDLQFNGGTLQSYDAVRLRQDATALIDANLSGATSPPRGVTFIDPAQWHPSCTSFPPTGGAPLGESCSPPVDSTKYIEHSVTISAFATDLQISVAPGPRRLFAPVRGVAAVTWADIDESGAIGCGQGADRRCDSRHDTGNDPNQAGDTRQVTMPGEPFGMAQTPDGTALVVTHQTDTKTSLLLTGLPLPAPVPPNPPVPSMQFVLDGLPLGGVGVASVPHDPAGPLPPCEAFPPGAPPCGSVGVDGGSCRPACVRPAFLETNHSSPEIDLLRYYDDDGSGHLLRPFLQRERVFPLTSNAIGTDSRGIAIDPTPRIACRARGGDPAACAKVPARVFFASRTPPALGIGEIGGPSPDGTGTYDPDQLTLTGNVPLLAGPSNVYLAPVVDQTGHLSLRVFVVLFDSDTIAVYDPDAGGGLAAVSYIDVGAGPFAMAFDPFLAAAGDPSAPYGPWTYVGERASVRDLPPPFNAYRFAYTAIFTQSYVQMIDLDDSQPTAETFEQVVFTLGKPTLPKGQ